MDRTTTTTTTFFILACLAWGCGDDDDTPADPELQATEAPATATTRTFAIDRDSSSVDFVMAAPLENIHGVAPHSMEGDLYIDLADITASRGLIRIDIDTLEIRQQRRESEDGEFGEEVRNETQNEHTRTWFQISDDAPAAVREANRWAQFNIDRISDASASNILEMDGDERRVTLTVHGDFRLHGHTRPKTARLELVFAFEGDEPRSVRVRTVEPIPVSLAEHEIRPRSAFGTLAQATLGSLGQKVAEAAPITFEVTANAGDVIDEMPPCAIQESAEATAACDLGVGQDPGEGGIPAGVPTAESENVEHSTEAEPDPE